MGATKEFVRVASALRVLLTFVVSLLVSVTSMDGQVDQHEGMSGNIERRLSHVLSDHEFQILGSCRGHPGFKS